MSRIYFFKFKIYLKLNESESCLTVSDSLQPHGLYSPWNSPGQKTGVSSCSFFQGIFPTQALNPGLPHCRRIIYQLNHQGSPRILEWVAYPFSSRSNWGLLHCRWILYHLGHKGSLPYRRCFLLKDEPFQFV